MSPVSYQDKMKDWQGQNTNLSDGNEIAQNKHSNLTFENFKLS